jgi:hypothetical protein
MPATASYSIRSVDAKLPVNRTLSYSILISIARQIVGVGAGIFFHRFGILRDTEDFDIPISNY